MPAASAKVPDLTPMVAVPAVLAVGVKVALYTLALTCTQPDSVPPVTSTSLWVKVLLDSDSVKVTEAV